MPSHKPSTPSRSIWAPSWRRCWIGPGSPSSLTRRSCAGRPAVTTDIPRPPGRLTGSPAATSTSSMAASRYRAVKNGSCWKLRGRVWSHGGGRPSTVRPEGSGSISTGPLRPSLQGQATNWSAEAPSPDCPGRPTGAADGISICRFPSGNTARSPSKVRTLTRTSPAHRRDSPTILCSISSTICATNRARTS